VDLHDLAAGRLDAPGIVERLLIPFDDGERPLLSQLANGAFQEGRLARAWRADQVQRQNPPPGEPATIALGKLVVSRHNLLFQIDRRAMRVRVMVTVVVRVGVLMTVLVMVMMVMSMRMGVVVRLAQRKDGASLQIGEGRPTRIGAAAGHAHQTTSISLIFNSS